jgi:hypothetical protein
MLIVSGVIFFFILGVIVLFASPRFSPIPYFPTNKKDLPLIMKALRLKSNQVIVDLGAGDGTVIFEAARIESRENLNTRFVAIEINPVLVLILYVRRIIHPNKKSIYIIWGNMFRVNYKLFISSDCLPVFYLYVSPTFIPWIVSCLKVHIENFTIMSYFYPIDVSSQPEYAGIHPIYTKCFFSTTSNSYRKG